MAIRKFTKKSLLLACALPLLMTGCAPTVAQRGNLLQDYQLKEIAPGTHTKSDVLKLIGSPSAQSTFNDNTWYYIGMETEKHGILDPKVTKERIVTITFDEEGMVKEIKDSNGKDGVEVPYATQSTPTHGNDLTIMQQMLGNLGRFNPQSSKPAGAD